MLLPGRNGSLDSYRYGFQRQEKDDEIKGEGNSINYTFRMHDPRVGRFFAVDPLTDKYPHYTPYSFSGNKVIHAIELEGLEELVIVNDTENCRDLCNQFLQVVQKDEILRETLLNSINKPELSEKYKVRLGEFSFDGGTKGRTYYNRRIRGLIKGILLYNKYPETFESDLDFDKKSIDYSARQLEALGITPDDYEAILKNKSVKYFGVLVNPETKNTDVDKIKTIAHEVDAHLVNAINYLLTGDKKYDKSPEEEHIELYGEEYYEKNNVNPYYSTAGEDVPKDSKAGRLYERIEKAYEKKDSNKG